MTTKGIKRDHVTTWFGENATALTPPLGFDLIAGGHSNLTFKVTDQADGQWVLRRPPLFQALESAHDMGREFRVIDALQNSNVPVPSTIGFCDDLTVNERPFYVMDFDDIDFYLSFASWRLASILEGVYSRYVSGAMGDMEPNGGAEAFVGRVDALVAQAADYPAMVA